MSVNKKRKASALEDDATPVKNGRKSPSSDRVLKKEEVTKLPDDYYDRPDPLSVECPAHPKKRKSSAGDDVFGPELESAGFANLDITYAVRPGSAWSSLKPYRNFIGEHVLSTLCIADLLICAQLANKSSHWDLLSISTAIHLLYLLRLPVRQKLQSLNTIGPTSGWQKFLKSGRRITSTSIYGYFGCIGQRNYQIRDSHTTAETS